MKTIEEVVQKHGLESPWEDRTVEELIAEWLDKEYRSRNGGLSSIEAHALDELREWIQGGYIYLSPEDYWIDHE